MAGNMDGNGDGYGRGYIYGFPSYTSQDRYTQNIINHTNDLYTSNVLGFPPLPTTDHDEGSSNGHILNPISGGQAELDHLDDFDRQLLGKPPTTTYSLAPDVITPRVSFPLDSISGVRQARVLGDASHHFKPFARQGEGPRSSQFISNPFGLNQLNPSPAAQSIFDRDGSHRISELQRGSQMVTPPLYTTVPRQSSSNSASLHSSSPIPGASSPSARLSLRRPQPRLPVRPTQSKQSSTSDRITLNLQHAPATLTPKIAGSHLIDPRAALPDRCRAVFPYELFNDVQSKCFPDVYGSDDNVVVSAPTGSGKTAILEMAICKLISTPGGENFKIVYQAPTKSLCAERAKDWGKKFGHLNLHCVELTGDTSPSQAKRVGSASIIVTTPEKWDSITRKWADHRKLLATIRLVLIDEVHILKDVRGATLEAVVSRMKTSGANVRFVALSATIPNLNDLANWLGRDHKTQNEPARQLSFGEETRPVKLKKYVHGYDCSGNDFIFDRTLEGKLAVLLGQYAERKPIMVFCFTRKSCEQTAHNLAEWWASIRNEDKAWPAPTERIPVINKALQETVKHGVAFHHAGLDAEDRGSVERNYLSGQLHVICCTSTLAVGVNLPCHTVVLKGTTCYGDDGLQEYSDLEVMQMLGRAGRPQFDRSATAIIMTKRSNVDRYEKMISGQELLESKLHLNLIEHLNSEIGLGTISDVSTAKKWLSGTFLYVRMRQRPDYYCSEISPVNDVSQMSPEDWIQAWCERDIDLLQRHSLITSSESFVCTEYGTAMSRYMVQFETMKQLLHISGKADIRQLLHALSQTDLFRDLRFKPQEKIVFRLMNPSVFYPIAGSISDVWHKVYLLVQISLGALELPPDKEVAMMKRQLATEKNIVYDRLNRLVRCVIDCKIFDGDGIGARAGLELTRALAANSWESHPTQLQQIAGLGPVTMRKFLSHGIKSVVDLSKQSFVDIERIISRNPPYGKNMLKSLDGFPRLTMEAEIVSKDGKSYHLFENAVTVTLRVKLGYGNAKVPSWNQRVPVVTFLAYTTEGRLANFWRGNIRKLGEVPIFELKFTVAVSIKDKNIICHFSCEEIVGTEIETELWLDVPASAFLGLSRQPGLSLQNRQPSQEDEGDIPDEDMLQALDASNAILGGSTSQPQIEAQSGEFDAEFPDIDDIIHCTPNNRLQQDAAPAAVQMANGKWKCNHNCAGGALTKTGKRCGHKCCHEGLDKPRPLPRMNKTINIGSEQIGRTTSDGSGMSVSGRLPRNQPSSLQRSMSSTTQVPNPPKSQFDGTSHASQPVRTTSNTKNRPKRSSSETPSSGFPESNHHVPKKQCLINTSDDDTTIDIVDLSTAANEDSEVQQASISKEKPRNSSADRLNDLHSRLQPKHVAASRITKPCKSLSFVAEAEAQIQQSQRSGSSYSDDVFSDEDLPSLAEILRHAEESQQPDSSQEEPSNVSTPFPGAFENPKMREDYGQEPKLSFTTCKELETASNRQSQQNFEHETVVSRNDKRAPRHHGHDQSPETLTRSELELTPAPKKAKYDVDVPSSVMSEIDQVVEPLFLDPVQLGSMPDIQQSASPLANPLATPLPGEPAWVGEYDQNLINMFRGFVDFTD